MAKWIALVILSICATSFAYAQKGGSYSKGVQSTVNEGNVVATSQGGVSSFILMEDGTSRILQEDNSSKIIVEP